MVVIASIEVLEQSVQIRRKLFFWDSRQNPAKIRLSSRRLAAGTFSI